MSALAWPTIVFLACPFVLIAIGMWQIFVSKDTFVGLAGQLFVFLGFAILFVAVAELRGAGAARGEAPALFCILMGNLAALSWIALSVRKFFDRGRSPASKAPKLEEDWEW